MNALGDKVKEQVLLHLSSLEPELVILFGSYASGDYSDNSDIDIAFLSKQNLSNVDRWEVQERLAKELGIDVDLVDMKKANDVINFQIVSSGMVIYENDKTMSGFFMDMVYRRYLQLNEDRKEILEYANR